MPFFDIIAAVDVNRGLGKNGDLVWQLKPDMEFFKEMTTSFSPLEVLLKFDFNVRDFSFKKTYDNNKSTKEWKENAVIMGRKTWDSLPLKCQPLPNRLNVVLSKNFTSDKKQYVDKNFCVAGSLEEALDLTEKKYLRYLIGGGELYKSALQSPLHRYIYVTQIKENFDCDTFFPKIEDTHTMIACSPWKKYKEIEYRFTSFCSSQYL